MQVPAAKIGSYHKSQGFTLVEVTLVVSIMLVAILLLFNVMWSMLSDGTAQREQLIMTYDRQTAMNIIENDIALTSRFLPTLDSGLTDPYLPTSNGGVWSYKGDSSTKRYLLLRSYSTTQNPLSSTREPVFIDGGGDCNTTDKYFNAIQRYNTIYFVKNNNLYRRRVVDTATATCDPQYQKTSCPSAADLGAAQSSSCGADDELLVGNVTNFGVDYYASRSTDTKLDVYTTGALPDLVSTALDAEITLVVSKKAGGKTITSQSTLRISKLNQDL